ncbi:ABC transporter permease [Lentibacillus saliphilus]|uniref:ABC transporter permease n=1 Tax=Lentibacillus saliphilus TaxID=2737028 RepID=UPI001C30DCEC|nr:ABC transporter permease [Lentibacillus saliphilus]
MFDAHLFFKKRFSSHVKELNRYLRYIFNGHIAFAMLFFVAASAYFYQQWLQSLPDNFPTALVIGIAFGLIGAYTPLQTLLKKPDLVFLIPVEHRMGVYFRNGLIYSYLVQLYLVLLSAAALGPLYSHTYPDRPTRVYVLMIVVLLVFKMWNYIAHWWMLKVRQTSQRRIDAIVRLLLSIAVFYFMIDGQMVFAAVVTVLFIGIFLYDWYIGRQQTGLAWDILLEKDQSRMQAFYRLANMFTDVPHFDTPIKKRHWLARSAKRVPWGQAHTYEYLYRLTFIRSDYLGMYVRLVVMGGIAVYAFQNMWMKIVFALLFIYMSTFQMMTLYHHHRTIIWLDLYPINQSSRKKALLKLLRQLTLLQSVLFAAVALASGPWHTSLIVLIVGVLFTVIFVDGYVKSKLNR